MERWKMLMMKKNKTPKRILYIQRPNGGGSSMSLLELVKALDKKQFTPIVLFYQDNVFRDHYECEGINVICVKGFNAIPPREHGAKNKFYIRSINELFFTTLPLVIYLVWIIKKNNIDLVHQNLGFDKAAMIASVITRTPQVCHFRLFSGISKTKKFLSGFVDAAIYISESIKNHYSKYHSELTSSQVIYNPIARNNYNKKDVRKLLKQELFIPENNLIISNVGRITPWKGQLYFLQALKEVIKKNPNIKVLIVGSTRDTQKDLDYFSSLKGFTLQTPELKDKVIFTGLRTDVGKIMAASDIVVHTAIEPEPFGRVIAEAMAAETPVIASNEGGVSEIIEHHVTGVLIAPKNIIELQNAILELINSNELSKSISIKAKDFVLQHFSIEQHSKNMQQLYSKVLLNRRRGCAEVGIDRQAF